MFLFPFFFSLNIKTFNFPVVYFILHGKNKRKEKSIHLVFIDFLIFTILYDIFEYFNLFIHLLWQRNRGKNALFA